jgi:uncharacterized membrane-anchored protein
MKTPFSPFFALALTIATAAHAYELDSIGQTVHFDYQYGKIALSSDLAAINLDSNFKYLTPTDASFVLERLWGNPPGNANLGMVLPANESPTDSTCWAIIIQFEEEGYVKDKYADKINYDKLLKQMQKETGAYNKEREKNGYEPIELIGWAEPPYYDAAAKKLYWAKEIKFGTAATNTLNYNIRILGRKGYLVLNVIAGMNQLATIKPYMQNIIAATEFKQGHTYAEFDPKLDKVATYGIAGLVAGSILVKAGFFKLLIAGIIALKKFLIIGLIALAAALRALFGKKKKEQVLEVKEEVKAMDDKKS